MKIIRKILIDNFETHYLNRTIYDCLNDLLFIISERELEMKLKIFNLVFAATHHIKRENYPFIYVECLEKFAIYFEQLIYEMFNNKIELLNLTEKRLIDDVLIAFNENLFYSNETARKLRIFEFILNKRTTNFLLSKKLQSQCNVFVRNSLDFTQNIDVITTKIFANHKIELFCLVERELKINHRLWKRLIECLKENWRNNDCKSGCCLSTQLSLFDEFTNMTLRLKLNTQFSNCFEEFTKYCSGHFTLCGPSVAAKGFLNALANCGWFCTPQNLRIILKLIVQPLDLPSVGNINAQNNHVKKCVVFLSSQKPDKLECLKVLCKLFNVLFLRDWNDFDGLKSDFVECLQEIATNCLTEASSEMVRDVFCKFFFFLEKICNFWFNLLKIPSLSPNFKH